MSKFGIAIHGGAGEKFTYFKEHQKEYESGLEEAVQAGYKVLLKGGSALKAVETAVIKLEDNFLFNAGRGSCLNSRGEVEMDASIMDGKTLKAGAVAMIHSVKNPVSLAKVIMLDTKHVMLSGYGALEFAIEKNLPLEKDTYFITEHQYRDFLKELKNTSKKSLLKKIKHGTVGAVALDKKGNLASATSTGGTSHSMAGRIGDSCIIGAGCYANNATCAVSGTGEGEFLITGVIGHSVSMYMGLKKYPIQQACDFVVHKRKKPAKGEIGIISIDKKGNFGITYNTEILKRAWIDSNGKMLIKF